MFDHPAKQMTTADVDAGVCSVCGGPVADGRQDLLHVGEARRSQIVPARADLAAVRRAELVAAAALEGLVWTPHLTDVDRARAVVEAIYAEGLIASRPRAVRVRRSAPARQPMVMPPVGS